MCLLDAYLMFGVAVGRTTLFQGSTETLLGHHKDQEYAALQLNISQITSLQLCSIYCIKLFATQLVHRQQRHLVAMLRRNFAILAMLALFVGSAIAAESVEKEDKSKKLWDENALEEGQSTWLCIALSNCSPTLGTSNSTTHPTPTLTLPICTPFPFSRCSFR
jgi:hypothetical protein